MRAFLDAPPRERARGVVAFAAVAAFVLVLAFLPPSQPNVPVVLTAMALLAAVILAALLVPWKRLPQWTRVSLPLTFLLMVALLRDAQGGAVSGLGPLVLVPLFWSALYGTPWSYVVVVGGVAATFVAPVFFLGDPGYPVTEWRRAAIWVAVAPVMGVVVRRLLDEVRTTNARLAELVVTDALTGIRNRRGWAELFERELARAARTGEPLAVALLDLDRFKAYNDEHGHQAGDSLLTTATAAWRFQLRATDVIARWGGEEFTVLLPGTGAGVAMQIVDRLRGVVPDGQTCSAGVAVWNRKEGGDALLRRADVALYAAKAAGRDRIVLDGVATSAEVRERSAEAVAQDQS